MRTEEQTEHTAPGDEWIDIATFGKTHGLKGEINVHLIGDLPELIVPGQVLTISKGTATGDVTIVAVREKPKNFLVRIEGWDKIEDAQPWVGGLLRVRVRDLPLLEEGLYYHYQLEGLEVFAANGEYLGVLVKVLPTGSNDVYCVRGEGREILVPAIRDAIDAIDLVARRMTLKDLDGLIEP